MPRKSPSNPGQPKGAGAPAKKAAGKSPGGGRNPLVFAGIGVAVLVVLLGAWFVMRSPGTSAAGTGAGVGAQQLSVAVTSAGYEPGTINAKSGTPIEITFSQGQSCMSAVRFPDLGVSQDLSQGPGTVKLGPLSPGTYRFVCSTNHRTGTLVVQ